MSIRGTSYTAAKAIKGRAKTLRARVFAHLLKQGKKGATLEEIELALAMPGNTVRPRRVELEELGMVVDSGERRPTKSGKDAIVWVVPRDLAVKALKKIIEKGITL